MTPRQLVIQMCELEHMIVESALDPDRYIGWASADLRAKCERQIELIHCRLKAGRCQGVMGKAAIRGILGNALLTSNTDALSWLQVELQNAIVSFSEDDREERRCDVALLFIGFVRSHGPVTDALVDELYCLLGNSFDDLPPGDEEGTYVG